MDGFGIEVRNELLMLKGKSASEITHGLKVLDGGENTSLIDNVIKVWEKTNENHQIEISKIKMDATIICSAMLGTVIFGCVCVAAQLRKVKKHDEVNQALIKGLKDEIKTTYCGEKNVGIVTESGNSYAPKGQDCVISAYIRDNNEKD